jgi:chromosome segregation ATPase
MSKYMASKLRAARYVTEQNLTKAFGTFERKMGRRFDRLEAAIENLAESVRQGFEAVDARFNATDLKIEAIQDDVKSLQGDVRRIDSRLARQQDLLDENRTGLVAVTGRVGRVEAAVGLGSA